MPLIGSAVVVGALVVLVLGIALVAGAILMLRTRDGTIVLKNVPPDAMVTVDGDRVSVELTGDGKTMAIRAVPGKHKVEVHRNGFKAQAQELTLAAGGREPIEVKLVPLLPPPVTPQADRPSDQVSPLRVLRGHHANVRYVQFTPDGSRVVSASNGNHDRKEPKEKLIYMEPGKDNSVRVWNASTGTEIRKFLVNEGPGFGARNGRVLGWPVCGGMQRMGLDTKLQARTHFRVEHCLQHTGVPSRASGQ